MKRDPEKVCGNSGDSANLFCKLSVDLSLTSSKLCQNLKEFFTLLCSNLRVTQRMWIKNNQQLISKKHTAAS